MKISSQHLWGAVFALLFVGLFVAQPAYAQGGVQQVNQTIQLWISILQAAAVGAVTIAIMWAGYKVMFAGAGFRDVASILIGGLLIGCAATVASYLIG